MGMRFLHFRLRMALLALLSLALIATGWGHRAPNPSDEALAFMAATGATAADFCGDVGDGTHRDPLCQACQIAGGVDLPPLPGAVLPLDLRVALATLRPYQSVAVLRTRDFAHAPQGPPVA
jgi:hypothetical protein